MKFKKLTSAVLLGLLVNQPIGFTAPVINPNDVNSGLVDNTSVVNSTFINQQTQNLSLNWNSFNINSNETVQFIQPNSSSIAFNHINSLDPSTIAGQLNANGQIVLINPNGLVFSEGASINVGGIIASGLNINSEQFLNGSAFLNHEQNSNGFVINNGVINAATGGSVTLVGTEVVNNGVITASLGKVNLAAGESGVLTFDAQGMFGVEITSNTVQNILGNDAAVTNNGEISSEGGQVLLTAEVSRDVFTNAVNNQGIVSANAIEMHDGFIRITSSTGDVQQDGTLDVSSVTNNVSGGTVEVLAENINNAGDIKADSLNANGGLIHLESNDTTMVTGDSNLSAQSIYQGVGGEINILGDFVGLGDNTVINTSGFNGGGAIHIGGGYQGSDNSLKNSIQTYVTTNVELYSNAIETGTGGDIIVWSDVNTNFYGLISATGGSVFGDGGFAEVSGKEYLSFDTLDINLSASDGLNGTLLLDPKKIKIEISGGGDPAYIVDENDRTIEVDFNTTNNDIKIAPSSIETLIDAGNNVFLNATTAIEVKDSLSSDGTGNLTLNAGTNINIESGNSITNTGTGELALNAGTNINVNGSINNMGAIALTAGGDIDISSTITSNGTAGAITLNADNRIFLNSALSTSGVLNITADFDDSATDFTGGYISLQSYLTLTGSSVNFNELLFSSESEFNNLTISGDAVFNKNIGSLSFLDFHVGKITVSGQATINTANIYTSKEQSYGSILLGDTIVTELNSSGSQGDSSITTGSISGNASALGSITLYTNPADSLGTISINNGGEVDDVAVSNIENLTIKNSLGTTITGSTSLAGDFTVTNTTGAVTLNGSLSAVQLITAATSDYSLAFNHGGTIGDSSSTTLNNTQGVSFGNASTDHFIFTNGLTNTAGATSLTGKLSSVDSSIELAALTVTTQGEINTGTGIGNISSTGIVSSDSVSLILNAGTGNISLTNSDNDFGNLILTATNADIVDTDDLVLGHSSLGSVDLGGYLNLTVDGELTNAASVVVAGNTKLTAGTNNITINGSSNSFSSLSIVNANNVTLTDTDGLIFGHDTIGGINVAGFLNVTLTGTGNLTDEDTNTIGTDVVGTTTLNVGSNTIDLQNTSNNFSSVLLTANTATILDSNTIDLGTSTIGAGGLSVTTTTGNITDSGKLDITGSSTFAVNTAGSDIILDSTDNIFTGAVNITNANLNNVTLHDTTALELQALTLTGNLNVTAEGITQSGNLLITGEAFFDGDGNGDSTGANVLVGTTTNNFTEVAVSNAVNVAIGDVDTVALGAITATGTLDVTSTGITTGSGSNAGVVDVAGLTTLNVTAAGNINLSNASNDFSNIVLTANNATLIDANSLVLGATGAGNDVDITTDLNITVANQAAGTLTNANTVTVGGNTKITAGTNNVTINGFSDNLNSLSIVSADAVTIEDINALVLGDSTNGGVNAGSLNITLTSASGTDHLTDADVSGTETIITGTSVFDVDTNNIVLDNALNNFSVVSVSDAASATFVDVNAIDLGAINVSDLFVTSIGGSITDSDALAISNTSNFTLNGTAVDLLLDNTSNSFGGAVSITMGGTLKDVVIYDTTDIELPAITATGFLTVDSEGTTGITQSGALDITGDATLTATNAINLQNVANDFGTVLLSANTATILDSNAIDLGTSTIGAGGLNVTTTTGNITDSGKLDITGSSTFAVNTAGSDIILDSTDNVFTGTVTITNNNLNNVTLHDTTALELQALTLTGNLNVTAEGITQSGNLLITGEAFFDGDGNGDSTGANVLVGTTTNNFTEVAVSNAVNVAIGDVDTVALGAITATGTLDVTSTGITTGSGSNAGAVVVTGATTLSAVGGDIVLTNVTNDFNNLSISNANLIDIEDVNLLTINTITNTGAITFSADEINLSAAVFSGTTTLTLNGRGGASTLTGTAQDLTWNISDSVQNSGSINNITGVTTTTFNSFGNLIGSTGIDRFNFALGSVFTGTLNGGTNLVNDVVDYTALTQAITVNLETDVINIEVIIADTPVTGFNTIIGFDPGALNINHWFTGITGSLSGEIYDGENTSTDNLLITYSGFASLTGGAGNDHFYLDTYLNYTPQPINGGGGTDDRIISDLSNTQIDITAIGPPIEAQFNFDDTVTTATQLFTDVDSIEDSTAAGLTLTSSLTTNTWDVIGTDSVRLNDEIAFGNVIAVEGGSGVDTFNIEAEFNGTLDGNGGDDVFEFFLNNTSVSNITNIIGGTGSDEIIGFDNSNWVLESVNPNNIDNATFAGIEILTGGTSNTLTSNIVTNAWGINAVNSTVGTYTFNNMNSLTGGSGIDTFTFNTNYGGVVNGIGGADIFEINTADLTGTAINGGTGANELNAIQTTAATNTWVITSDTAGTINGGDFTDVNQLTGSVDVDVTDNLTSNIASNAWGINAIDSTVGAYTFNNMNSLTGGTGVDTFTFNANFGGTVNGIDGADIFEINTADLTGTAINGGAGANELNAIQTTAATNTWVITSDTAGTINGGDFTDVNQLTGSVDVDVTDNLTSNIATNAWGINAIDSTVGAYTFNNMNSLTGGTGVDTFTFNANFGGAVNGIGGADIFEINTANLIGTAINGGTGANELNAIQITTATNTWVITSDTAGTINGGDFADVNQLTGSVDVDVTDNLTSNIATNVWGIDAVDSTVGAYTFNNMNSLTGGSGIDTFTFNTNYGGVVNGIGGADIFEINTANLIGTAINGGTGANELNAIQTTAATNTWVITSDTAGTINGGDFTDVNQLTGSVDVDVTDNLTSNIASNAWGINAIDSTVGAYTFNNMNSITGGTGVDTFTFNANFGGTVNGIAGADIFEINTTNLIGTAINGGTGANELNAIQTTTATNTWVITSDTTGTINGGDFTDVNKLTGSVDVDVTDNLTSNIATNAWGINAVDSTVGAYTFNNMNSLTGGTGVDTFTFNANFGGTVNGFGGADIFEINTTNLIGTAINGGTGANELNAIQITTATNTWVIASDTAGTINSGDFTDVNKLTGSADVDVTDNLTSNIATNAWGINAVDSTVGAYTFNNMNSLTGGSGTDTLTVNVSTTGGAIDTNSLWTIDVSSNVFVTQNITSNPVMQFGFSGMEILVGGELVDTFVVQSLISPMTINGSTGIDILRADLIANELTIGNSLLGNGSLPIGAQLLTFTDIQIFEDSGQTVGDFIITGESTGESYLFDIGGSVSFGNLSFSNVDVLNAGTNLDTFQINGDFGGVINGNGGDDVFQINTPLLSSATTLNGLATSNDVMEGIYSAQSGLVDYNWAIDSATSGSINTAIFNNINILNGSIDSDVTDSFSSNIATNTWQINSLNSTVNSYIFNNMENITGGSLVDTFTFDGSITGDVNGSGGDDIFNINVANAANSFNGDAGIDTFIVGYSDQLIAINGGSELDKIILTGASVDSSSTTVNSTNVIFTHADSSAGSTQTITATGIESIEDNTASMSSSLNGSAASDSFGLFEIAGFDIAVTVTPELNIYYQTIDNLSIDMAGGSDFVTIDTDVTFSGLLDITSESITSTNDSSLVVTELVLNDFETIGSAGNGLNIGSGITDGQLQLTLNNSNVINATDINLDFINATDPINIVSASVVGDLNINTLSNITASGSLTVSGDIIINGNSSVDVTLDNAANDFSGISLNNLNSVSLVNTNPILLSTVSVNDLVIDTVGNISSVSDISVTNTLSLDTNNNSFDITLVGTNNNLNSIDIVQANNATINNSNALNLGDINIAGDLVLMLDGELTQTGVINVSTLNAGFTGVYDVDLMNSNDINNLIVSNAGNVLINDIGGLTVGTLDAVTASIQTTGSVTQTAAWTIDNGLSITMVPGDSLVLTNVDNVINGTVSFNTTVQDGFFSDVSFYNNGSITLDALNVTNTLDIQSNGGVSAIGVINIAANGTASFNTDLDNSGDYHVVSLIADNSLSNLSVVNASVVDVVNVDSLTLDTINIGGDFTLQINPNNTLASYTLDNTGDISVAGDTTILVTDNDVIDLGSLSTVNLMGDASLNVQTGTLASFIFTSPNELNLQNSSLITQNELIINADLVLTNDLLLQSNTADVTHSGDIDGFANLTVNALQGNIEFTNSMIGQSIALNTVDMTAEVINVGKINAINGITLLSTVGGITLDQLYSDSNIDLTSAANITSNTYDNVDGYSDITANVLTTTSVNGVSGLNGSLHTSVNEYSGTITGSGDLLLDNLGTIELSGISLLDGDIYISSNDSINQTADIIIEQGTNTLSLLAGNEITMFDPATSTISHGDTIYEAENTVTISKLTVTGGDGVVTDSIYIESISGNIATTNANIDITDPDVTANLVTFLAPTGSLGIGAQQVTINADKLVTIATVFSNQPLYAVTPEGGVIDSSTIISPTDTSSLLGGDQRTQFSELSTVDPTIFTEVRNFEEDETAILLPEDQLYTANL